MGGTHGRKSRQAGAGPDTPPGTARSAPERLGMRDDEASKAAPRHVPKSQQLRASHLTRRQAHASGRTRRAQGRRDKGQ